MFERFTEPARRALFFARFATTEVGGITIEAEHILIGLLRSPDPVLTRFLNAQLFPIDSVRAQVEEQIRTPEKVSTSAEIPFSVGAKRLLELCEREADMLGHSHIGTEHMVLAMLRQDGPLATLLTSHGLRLGDARDEVARLSRPDTPSAPSEITVNRADVVAHIERIQQMAGETTRPGVAERDVVDRRMALMVELEALKARFQS
jgi:ATP-dependent Clp protease ATP-binding subunit ClpC